MSLLALTCVASWSSSNTEATSLSDYILDYQPLHFDHAHVHEKHRRVRREAHPALRWNFKAYGRTFKLHLEPDTSIFHPDHTLEVNGKGSAQPSDTSFFYQGYLTDVPGSSAHMSIHDDHVWGQVTVPGHTTYYIEPAQHHLRGNNSFHTIIYPESRMNLDPYRHRMNSTGVCPTDLYRQLKLRARPVDSPRRVWDRHQTENPYYKYLASVNGGNQDYRIKSRKRRAAGELASSPNKACFMQLRADALLYNHFMAIHDKDEARTEKVILSLFASHIKQLTEIYLDTRFQYGSNPAIQGISFVLQRSTIIKDCTSYNQDYCRDTLDVSNYLDLTSEENHNEFCLVHTFTYRDFVGGTLGLAWVAEPESGNAGVCGKYGKIRDSNKGIVSRSLNTGIVTLINYNQDVPSRVSQITLAHEVGHNFGSEHDQTDQCAPYGTSQSNANDGNYIMFPNAIPGTMANNRKFSPCSTSAIGRVLETVGGIRENCFAASDQAFCGNKIVEDTEQCDCGYKEDCDDQCCYGRGTSESEDCKRKPDTVCSPSQGQCCLLNCTFVESSVECAAPTDCTERSFCNGTNATCPPPVHKQDYRTFCNDYGAVCEQGECEASVCRYIDWEECFKTSEDGFSEEDMCYVSCRKDASSECIGSNDEQKVASNPEFARLLDIIKTNRSESSNAIKLSAGAYCDNFKGFCDVFAKCRKVDAEGPFKQLTDLIFDPVTFKNIRNWAEDHWWAVLLMCVGVIIFMGVFVFVFGYNTPSQDPRKKRRAQQNAAAGRGGAGANGRRVDKRSGPYSVPIPLEERPRSGVSRNSGAYLDQGARPLPDPYPGRDNYAYDNKYDGRDNYGYGDQAYQPPPPYQPPSRGQQFDRIQGQRY